jgi:RNA polymerase sigma factor (sigma-70 family)
MTKTMTPDRVNLGDTRASLLQRMRDVTDHSSWQDFFDTYWKLIYGVSRQAGLTEAEAQDAVQEVMIDVARDMPTFRYDPARGSFKAWLLIKTRWKIVAQFRKRGPLARPAGGGSFDTEMDPVPQVPDPASLVPDAILEEEWRQNIFAAAWDRVKRKVDPQRAQIFDFNAIKGWKAEKVAATFQVPVPQVHMIKHRIKELIEIEVRRLEREAT